MNKRQIIASLNKIANQLDNLGNYDDATQVTKVMFKIAQEDPGQDDPMTQQGLDDRVKLNLKLQELESKIAKTTKLDELYLLKNQLLDNPSLGANETSNLIDDINAKITNLEFDVLHKFEQMISKPYFESNIEKFKAMGQAIESNPEFKTLNKNTQQKIRSYYFNLDKKIQTRVQEKENTPLLNSDTMINKPDQISNFAIKNMQYEINKIINKKTFQPIMQDYLSSFLESEALTESEQQRQRNYLIKLYYPQFINTDGTIDEKAIGNDTTLRNMAYNISDPKNVGVRQSIKNMEQSYIVEDLMDEFIKFQQNANTIFENSKEYARTKSEKNFKPLDEITVPRVDFAPSRTINNLNTFIINNAKSLSKSVADANKLLTFANDAYQKVERVLTTTINPNPDSADPGIPPLFNLPQTDEEMQKFINMPDRPLYPGSRPPES